MTKCAGNSVSPRDFATPARQQAMAKSPTPDDNGTVLPLSILAIFALISLIALSAAETNPQDRGQRLEMSSLADSI